MNSRSVITNHLLSLRNESVGGWGIRKLSRVRRAGCIFPYAASKNRSEYVSIPRNLFLAYEKIKSRTVRRSLKRAKFFSGEEKSAGIICLFRAFLTKHGENFAALNRRAARFPNARRPTTCALSKWHYNTYSGKMQEIFCEKKVMPPSGGHTSSVGFADSFPSRGSLGIICHIYRNLTKWAAR